MKFSKKLTECADKRYISEYISYKDLKRAIKIITGSDVNSCTIQDVVTNFGNTKALEGRSYRTPESRFQDLLNFELEKINRFTQNRVLDITGRLTEIYAEVRDCCSSEVLIHRYGLAQANELSENDCAGGAAERGSAITDDCRTSSEQQNLNYEAALDIQASEILFLDSYVRLNFTGFRKITKKYDKHNRSAASRWYMSRVVKQPFMNLNFSQLLHLLSCCYAVLRRLKETGESVCSVPDLRVQADEQPADLTRSGIDSERSVLQPRSCTKYLILPDELIRVKVLMAKHLPLKAAGGVRVDDLTPDTLEGCNHVENRIPTMQVYLDNQRFDTYISMQTKRRGTSTALASRASSLVSASRFSAQPKIFRFRHQGYNEDLSRGHAHIWLEQCALNEPASDLQQAILPSEEVDIQARLVESVLLEQDEIVKLLRSDGENAHSQILQRLSDKGCGESHVECTRQLLRHFSEAVKTQHIEPCIRVWLYRTAFCSEDSGVHVMLDEDIRFSGEMGLSTPEGWIRPHTAALAANDLIPFPWGVMDVSISRRTAQMSCENSQGDVFAFQAPEESVDDFLREITGLASVTEVWGFSLFIHGVASLYKGELQRLNSSAQLLPHWLPYTTNDEDAEDGDGDEDISASTPVAKKTRSPSPGISSVPESGSVHGAARRPTNLSTLDVLYKGPSASLAHDQEASVQEFGLNEYAGAHASSYAAFDAVRGRPEPCAPAVRRVAQSMAEPLLSGERYVDDRDPSTVNQSRTRWCPRWLDLSLCIRVFSFSWWSRSSRRVVPRRTGDLRTGTANGGASSAVRVEPKTFFANERTLLQWMNMAVLLSTIAITLMNFGNAAGKAAGLIMAPIAVFFIGYSFWVYLRRARALERKEPINYNDKFGPAVLVISLMMALIANILLNVL